MQPSKRRKISPSVEDHKPTSQPDVANESPGKDAGNTPTATISEGMPPNPQSAAHSDRLARFAALKSRSTASARSNLAEAKAEANRSAINPTTLANLSRRSAIASHNLLKADTEAEEGEGAFERKRAWDYTIEESEKWDERLATKKAARDQTSFQDYSAEAAKIYDRQIRQLDQLMAKEGNKSKEEYERQKAEMVEKAARSGGLEIVEMENGEMVAIDKEGRFYADTDSLGFVEQKPKKENVDRLVEDIRKAEEVRLKKRKERGQDGNDGDVTYINEKNKQFNMKLARFYDRYTTDIREAFERGTAI